MEIPQLANLKPPPLSATDSKLRHAASRLEGVFISEMLKSAGFGKAPSSFGGGIGEEQFSSFLVEQQANSFAKTGGFGLAEHIFNAMKSS